MADTAEVNGIRIAYEDDGPRTAPARGCPLVLIHGHPFDRSMWDPQRAAFRERRRVIVPDLRGYGETTVVPGTTPLSVFAEDLRALLDHLGVEEFVLGGLSMGGQIAMECLPVFGERIRGLLLADTFAEPETEDGVRARRTMADQLSREGMNRYAADVLTRMVEPAGPRPEATAHVLRMMRAAPPEGAAAALRGRALRPDYRPLLRTVRVPALVVVGRLDTYTPVRDAASLHALVPDSELHVIEGAAHLPNLERPEAFDAALAGLLRRVDS
ncbi:alpha/beta fold hydrolase [Streptomyces sp. NPDC049954]|uniref:alpha/beta fold hydrolase n=1 Tax=Streptomyces sp. NPDC049954 TaxID=3155779 RepID=UPI003440A8E3